VAPGRSGRFPFSSAGRRCRIGNGRGHDAPFADKPRAFRCGIYGYFDLAHLSAEEYRKNKRISTSRNRREWLSKRELFEADGGHVETLSPAGRARIDGVVTSWAGSLGASPLIVEGYSTTGNAADEMSLARRRAILVREYIRSRFRLDGQMIAVEPLGSQPPSGLGHDQWDGVSVLLVARSRH